MMNVCTFNTGAILAIVTVQKAPPFHRWSPRYVGTLCHSRGEIYGGKRQRPMSKIDSV
jgi:hypothetical protein